MTEMPRTLLVCSCEDTLPIDQKTLAQVFPGSPIHAGRQLCGDEIGSVLRAATADQHPIIACTRMSAVFDAAFEDHEIDAAPAYVNIREMAGWSRDGKATTPKMAALIAVAAAPGSDVPMTALSSEGVTIVYGSDETAFDVAARLADSLDITVLLRKPGSIAPPRAADYPIFKGSITTATGHLGTFQLKVDDFAALVPSSRATLRFVPPRNGATSHCDVIIDLSGGTPLFPAADLRSGYLRADPRDRAAVERLIGEARDLVGTFDKPRYITFDAGICAHSRSRIVGCSRCLDVCPTGAISPAGDHVAIDAGICAGCGGCAALCPTGAATYALPAPDVLMGALRTLLTTYARAGGKTPVVLLHDDSHGTELLHLLSHHGDGLPAHVLPLRVSETTAIGLEQIAAAFAYGASAVRILTREKPHHDDTALQRTLRYADAILEGFGFAGESLAHIATDDADALGTTLRAIVPRPGVTNPAAFLPAGTKRQLQRLALRELAAVAPQPAAAIALPEGAPMGRVHVRADGCTLCLACVSACPTAALTASPDRPELKFQEDLCIQCGLCARTCPEKVITLEPRLDIAALSGAPVVLKNEDPYPCDRCGKHFGTRATIARIREKLSGNHWMFSGANAPRLELIGLCEDCRVIVATRAAVEPYATSERPRPRTAADYETPTDPHRKPNGHGES